MKSAKINAVAKELGITPEEVSDSIQDIKDGYEEVRSMLRAGKDRTNTTWYIGFYDGYYQLKHKTSWVADKHYFAGYDEGESEGAGHFTFQMLIPKSSLK